MVTEGVYWFLLLVPLCGGIIGTKGGFQSWSVGQKDRKES